MIRTITHVVEGVSFVTRHCEDGYRLAIDWADACYYCKDAPRVNGAKDVSAVLMDECQQTMKAYFYHRLRCRTCGCAGECE
jgi:hypothetical protein